MNRIYFMKHILYLLLLFIFETISAQPLEFYDYADSVKITEMKVHYTHSDSSWLQIGIARDSLIIYSKYDYCGHLKYQKAFFVPNAKLSGLHTSIETTLHSTGNSDTIYVACLIDSNNYHGICCQEFYPHSGSSKALKPQTIDSTFIYSNTKIISNSDERIIFFNAGTHLDSMSGYILRTDKNFSILNRFKLSNNLKIRDVIPLKNNVYFLTIGNRIIAKLNNTNTFDYVFQLDSLYNHFDQNLTQSESNHISFIGDYRQITNENTIALLKFNTLTEELTYSNNLVRYNPKINPSIKYYKNIVDSNKVENYVLINVTNHGATNTFLTTTLFENLTSQKSYGLFLNKEYTSNFMDIDYLPAENNFVFIGHFQDTQRLFQAKLNKFAKLTNCYFKNIPNVFKVDSIGIDTFNSIQTTSFPSPKPGGKLNSDTMTYSFIRQKNCKYFDFIIDTTMMSYCDGNTDTTFNISIKSNDQQSINNPFVKYLWKDDNTTDPSNTIKWNANEKAYLSKYVIITYCDEVDTSLFTTVPQNCPPNPKLGNVFVPSHEDPINKLYGIVLDQLDSTRIKELKWSIFNRWGQKVYSSNSAYEEWDGNFKGEPAPMGTYSVVIEVADIYNKRHTFKKMFTLIR